MTKNLDKNTLGYRLAKVRFELGFNKKQLADKIKVSPQCVARYENNERVPDYNYLEKLVNMFDVDAEYIFGKSEVIFKETVYTVSFRDLKPNQD